MIRRTFLQSPRMRGKSCHHHHHHHHFLALCLEHFGIESHTCYLKPSHSRRSYRYETQLITLQMSLSHCFYTHNITYKKESDGVGGGGGPSRMLVPSGHPGRSNSRGPLDSSPLNPMVGVQSPLHPVLQAHSPMSGVQAQSPSACVRQGPSPLTPTMPGQSPLNAAMAGQVQAPSKPHMHPSPLHGDPGSR